MCLLFVFSSGDRHSDLANEFELSSIQDVTDITRYYSLYDVIVNRSDYEPYSSSQEEFASGSQEKEFTEEFAVQHKKTRILKPNQ